LPRPDGVPQLGFLEVRFFKQSALQVCIGEVSALKVSPYKISLPKVSPTEVSTFSLLALRFDPEPVPVENRLQFVC
jgi:hypothetical protein